jgi:3-hydroxy-9,10-secoandrosta-1,3,5(10)-triene-9,17-dione monooxygenase
MMTKTAEASAATGDSPEVVARARALIPVLRGRAEDATRERRLPKSTVEDLIASGVLKVIQSTRNGGYGLSMREHLDVIAALAEGCGSNAWVAGVVHAHSWLVSHFPAQAQDEVYGQSPNAIVSAVIGPRGKARRDGDGYVVDGVWPFASGSEHASWLLLGAVVLEGDEVVDEADLLIPTSDVTYRDDWFVTGLVGTGSCTVSLDGVQVPLHRYLSLPKLIAGDSPGMHLHEGWLQRCAPVPVLALAITGASIGLARRALEEFPGVVTGKTIAYTADVQSAHPTTHLQVAEAAMSIEQGRLLLYRCADEIDAAAQEDRKLDLLTRARMRLDCAEGVRRALEGVEILFMASGGSGVRATNPLGRALADLQAINLHGLLNLETNREMFGRLLLGLEPNTPLI